MNHIFISAGENSGDFYGARLASFLLKKKKVKVSGFGGPKMAAAGVDIKVDLVSHAIVGFIEVVLKFIPLALTFNKCVSILKKEKPKALVVIDYPGFHLKLIKAARKAGIKKIIYYIAPQVWAWKYERIKEIKKYASLVIVKWGFEEKIFRKEKIRVKYCGHPMAEYLLRQEEKYGARRRKQERKTIRVGLFPGSRRGEVKMMLPAMLKAAGLLKKNFDRINFVILRAPGIREDRIKKIIAQTGAENVLIKAGNIKALDIDYAISKSGTTTLELALLRVPQVIVYRLPRINFMIAKSLLRIKYIGLPNLVLGRALVPELIQDKMTPSAIAIEITRFVRNKKAREKITAGYREIKKLIYRKNAAGRIGDAVYREALR